jgi:2-succinyl-6-hydroxy-2,4-cyclohexadiene-1-carboxylate synthase
MKKKNYQFNFILAGNPGGKVLVLLHGFLGNIADWKESLFSFGDTFYCLAIDLPGHGQTRMDGRESSYSISNCAAGIMDLLAALKIDRANLVGYSMGGRLALYLAVYYPQHWYKVIVASASPGLPAGPAKKERWWADQQLAVKLEKGDIRQFVSTWYRQPLFASLRKHPEFPELKKFRWHNNPLELARSLRGLSIGKQPSLWNKLTKIPLPVMMMVGEFDHKYKKIGRELIKKCPDITLKVVEKCGHMIHFENPQLFNGYVRSFLQAD